MFEIVARSFKTNGMLYEVGSVVTDPSLIRRYLLKIREGKILCVDLADEKSKAKFDKLVLKHKLNVEEILKEVGVSTPSAPKKSASKKKKQTKSDTE